MFRASNLSSPPVSAAMLPSSLPPAHAIFALATLCSIRQSRLKNVNDSNPHPCSRSITRIRMLPMNQSPAS